MAIKHVRRELSQVVVVGVYIVDADNETRDLYTMPRAGRIQEYTFFSSAALGGANGIDVLNGGSSGTGTTVLQACTDNLNGDESVVGAADEVARLAVIRVRADDYTAARDVGVQMTLELYGY